MLRKVLVLLALGFTGNVYADCPSSVGALGAAGHGDFWQGNRTEEIRGSIQMLLSVDTIDPTTRWVIVSDEGVIEGADTTPRGTLEMGASSNRVELQRLSSNGKTSLYRLFGAPNSIGRILERLSIKHGAQMTGLRFIGTEQPNLTSSTAEVIQQLVEASSAEGTRRAVQYSPRSWPTKTDLAAASKERLANLLENGDGYRYKTTVGVDSVIAVLNSEEFQSEVETTTGERDAKVIELVDALNSDGLIRQAVVRSGTGRRGETVNYYFEIYVEWSEVGKAKQGQVIKLYYQFGD